MTAAPAIYSIPVGALRWLDEDAFELTCARPPGFSFLAGQYVTLSLDGLGREYTIISAPDAPELKFLIKYIPDGALSAKLARLEPGNKLTLERVKGYLTYRSTAKTVVFVATGVGIAPFVSMAAQGITGFSLIHGVRKLSGLYYRQQLMTAAGSYSACLSGTKTEGNVDLPVYQGYVTEFVRTNFQPGEYEFYLCGSRAMIHDMTHMLDEYFPGTVIYSEAYS